MFHLLLEVQKLPEILEFCHAQEKTEWSEATYAYSSRKRRNLGSNGKDALLNVCIKIVYLKADEYFQLMIMIILDLIGLTQPDLKFLN